MNQKKILAVVAIIATVGIVIAASSIATPALARELDTRANPLKVVSEKDTKSYPNNAEIGSSQEGHHNPH
jgi:hypothetical protein